MNISPNAFDLLDDWISYPEVKHKFSDFLVFEQSDLELLKGFTNKKYATAKSKRFWMFCFPEEKIEELANFGQGDFKFLLHRVVNECCSGRRDYFFREEIKAAILDAFEFGEDQKFLKFHQLYTTFKGNHSDYQNYQNAIKRYQRSAEFVQGIDLTQQKKTFMEEN